jgi:hypothetical protein
MLVGADEQRGALLAEAGQPGDAVGGIAGQRQVVGHAARAEAAQRAERRLVGELVLAAIDLHHAVADDALPEILVGRHDAHLLDLAGEAPRAVREPVVGFVLVHRPDRDPDRGDPFLDRVELRTQLGRHALVALVLGKEIVAE